MVTMIIPANHMFCRLPPEPATRFAYFTLILSSACLFHFYTQLNAFQGWEKEADLLEGAAETVIN